MLMNLWNSIKIVMHLIYVHLGNNFNKELLTIQRRLNKEFAFLIIKYWQYTIPKPWISIKFTGSIYCSLAMLFKLQPSMKALNTPAIQARFAHGQTTLMKSWCKSQVSYYQQYLLSTEVCIVHHLSVLSFSLYEWS